MRHRQRQGDRKDPDWMLDRLEEEYQNQRVLRGWYDQTGAPLDEEELEAWVEYSVWTTVN